MTILLKIPRIISLRWILPKESYAQINRWVMTIIFCVPLVGVALYESITHARYARRLRALLTEDTLVLDDEDDEHVQDPECTGDDAGKICECTFDELVKEFPK